MVTLALALIATSGPKVFAFKGGTAQDLVDAIAEEQAKPVTVMLEPGQKFAKFEIRYSDAETFHRILQARSGLHEANKETLGLGPKAWPQGVWRKMLWPNPYTSNLQEDLELKPVWADDRVTFRTHAGKGLTLNRLGDFLKVPLKWDPFYQDIRVAVAFQAATPAEALETVASAIGAELKETNGAFSLELAPKAIRTRGIAMCQIRIPVDVPQLQATQDANQQYLEQVLRAYSDNRIRFFFSGKQGMVPFGPGHSVYAAAIRRAEAFLYASTPEGDFRPGGNLAELIRDIDPSKPVQSSLRPDGSTSCDYHTKNGSLLGF